MSEEQTQATENETTDIATPETTDAPADTQPSPAATRESTPPSLIPAFVIVTLHLLVTFGVLVFGSTNIQNTIGLGAAPVVAALALIVWWATSRGVPARDRILGLAIFGASVLIIVLTHGQRGMYLLIVALPVLTTGIVLLFAIARNSPWEAQRRFVTTGIIVCTVVFALVRVDAVGGDLIPHLAFRWSPESTASVDFGGEDPSGVAALPEEAAPGDWTGFRGEAREGRALGVEFGTDWKQNPPRELWRRPVGLGWSSFAVVGDYIFTQEQRGDDELVVCYEAATGEPVWVNRTQARFDDVTGSGPRATPTFHAGKLYAQGATGVLQCFDASTGDVLWSRDLKEDTGAAIPTWGFASSPAIVGDNVVVFSGADDGKSVVAYNKDSGEIAWMAGKGDHGYSSAQLVSFVGTPQLLMASKFGIQAFAPATGDLLWEHEWDLGSFARIVQPNLTEPNSVLVASGPRIGTRSLRVQKGEGDTWEVGEEWTTKRFRPYFNDFVFHKGFCYGFDGNRLTCIDAATGYTRWSGDRTGGQILVIDKMNALLILSEAGDVILMQATPNEPIEIARFHAIDGKTWNHPVVANGKLFVRNSDEMAAFEMPPP